MASHDDDQLDFNKLQREMDAAVEKDARYWRENDAKIRAVSTQRVATYEEFKELVAASHLQPLNKGDHIDNIKETGKLPWNPAALGSKQNSSTIISQTQHTSQPGMKVPKTSQELSRDWQRSVKTPEQRLAYLLRCGAARLADLFKTEVTQMGDVLAALNTFSQADVRTVLDILQGIKASSRFSLSMQFLSNKEKEVCADLFHKLSETSEREDLADCKKIVAELKSAYLS